MNHLLRILTACSHIRMVGLIAKNKLASKAPAIFCSVVALGMATVTQASTKCLEVEVIKPERMYSGTTAFIDNSGSSSKIIECDAQGNTVWEYEIPAKIQPDIGFTNDLEWLPGQDHFLFTSRGRGIFEVDRSKTIVWSYATSKVSHDADRLPNGNTLFAWGGDSDSDAQFTEITPQGNVVWQWFGKQHLSGEKRYDLFPGRKEPYSYTHANAVIRLPSGNTLISLRNFHMVLELAPDGNIAWKLGGLERVHDPYLLPNDNMFVSLLIKPFYHPVREVTRSGEIVWEYFQPDLMAVTTIAVLPNGNILLAGQNKIVEVTRDKEVVWRAILPGVNPQFEYQQKHFYKVVRIPTQR
ncbi:MAG: aryl-sulfate sulfotransferase [Proteobacteria bacterium]|nr:aryl-sulfate sulfotransferase [Pseudomonadota bacterium]